MLSYTELHELVEAGVIRGVRDGAINSSSIDIHLGDKVLIECDPYEDWTGDDHRTNVISYRDRSPLEMTELDMRESEGVVLLPNDFILAQSIETFHLPPDISAQYRLKSSMARIGLEHLNAGHCDAGWHGSVLTLELKNVTRYHAIHLQAGDPIGQMVFWRHTAVPEDKSYAVRGRYNGDKFVRGIKE
jgi:dCTP deaminase